MLGYHGADNVGFLLLFFREASDKEIQTIVYKYIELLEGYFTGIARRARYGISGFHDSFDGLHEAFLETGSAFNAMAMRMNLPYLFSDRLPMEQVTLNCRRGRILVPDGGRGCQGSRKTFNKPV